ncbi:hypothetical protein [Luteimonas huabeiensis]|uniref:hypothetical protein n=1 Tax=Luteimonas huabeiensis TaxID=1244513 RepID=UPI00046776B1|nr:hypothetical protein [Luteimonas huabeiensis]
MPAFPIPHPRSRRLPFAAVLALLLSACAAPQPPAAAAPQPAAPAPSGPVADSDDADGGPAAPGVPELRTACAVDSDCVVKDVGNCCGAYPACVHRDSPADPQAVMAECQRSGMASVCGFREIQSCACVQNRCEATDAATPVVR